MRQTETSFREYSELEGGLLDAKHGVHGQNRWEKRINNPNLVESESTMSTTESLTVRLRATNYASNSC